MTRAEPEGPIGAETPGRGRKRLELRVDGMDCPSCVAGIRRRLETLDGVLAAEGSAAARRLIVEYDDARLGAEAIRQEIGELGYAALPVASALREPIRTWGDARARRTYLSGGLFGAGLLVRWLTGTGAAAGGGLLTGADAAGWLFLTAAAAGAWNFLPRAVRAAGAGRLDMNVLMGIAILGAAAIGEHLEAAAIAFLFSTAELLERFALERAERSVRALMDLAPPTACVVRGGREMRVPAGEVRIGEEIHVRPGERVPVDGVVVDGASAVDEAAITGESMPVEKGPGAAVFAGTLVRQGFLRVRATHEAESSTLSRMVRLIEAAEARRSPSERFVERFARIYTPTVVVGAVLVVAVPVLLLGGALDEWLLRGLTLLVIACPCALVISTPVSVVSGVTSAARNGVLIKDGRSLEAMGRARVIAFDKTGTLTHGCASLVDVLPVDGVGAGEVLRLAALAEARSEHPLGRAIVRAARAAGVAIDAAAAEAFESLPGRGVRARVGGEEIAVGRPSLHDDPPEIVSRLTGEGKTALVVLRDGSPLGVLGLRDEPRPAARRVVGELRAAGARHVVVLTGDSPEIGRAVAGEVGADEVLAALGPVEKVEAVRALERRHGPVAMVGDGVNDAPALAAASVGIAMGAAGSDAALETADIALLGDDLSRLPYLYRLSRRGRRVIRQNIAAAILVKGALAVGVPLGAVSLIVAVLVGDMGASLAVMANAMRLARVRD